MKQCSNTFPNVSKITQLFNLFRLSLQRCRTGNTIAPHIYTISSSLSFDIFFFNFIKYGTTVLRQYYWQCGTGTVPYPRDRITKIDTVMTVTVHLSFSLMQEIRIPVPYVLRSTGSDTLRIHKSHNKVQTGTNTQCKDA